MCSSDLLWLGPEAGLVSVRDSVPANELGPSEAYWHAAPTLGAGVGLQLGGASWLSMGLSLRGYVDLFGDHDGPLGRQPRRVTVSGLGFALVMSTPR